MENSKNHNKPKVSKYVKDNKKISKGFSGIFDIVESLVYAITVVVFVFLFIGRLSIVDGNSMNNTLNNRDYLIVVNPFYTYTPEYKDIVVVSGDFEPVKTIVDGKETYVNEYDKPLVKRIIATGGQSVVVNFKDNTVTIDGIVYEENYAVYLDSNGNHYSEEKKLLRLNALYSSQNGRRLPNGMTYDSSNYTLSLTVPEGFVFAMGDNRFNSADSREYEIGFIRESYVVGKVVCRVLPLNKLGGVK